MSTNMTQSGAGGCRKQSVIQAGAARLLKTVRDIYDSSKGKLGILRYSGTEGEGDTPIGNRHT